MTDAGKQRAAEALRQMRTPRTGDEDPDAPTSKLRQEIRAAQAAKAQTTTDPKERQ